jgi:FAD/FMN-containing dehydrogenase
MESVAVANGVATVGAGARLGRVYEALGEHGLAIPAGTCPTVGVAGLTLGGGLGILGRTYGVTSDRLVAARIVLADGRIVDCDEHHHEDLFWGLRGAGAGNFGVVTSLAFRPVPAPEATNFHLAWSFEVAAAVIAAWQAWAPDGPDGLAASLKVTLAGEPGRAPSVDVYGALQGGPSDATGLVGRLVDLAGADPIASWSVHMSFPETRRWWADLGATEDHHPIEHPYLFAKSEFFRRTMPPEVVAALLERFTEERSAGEARELDFMPWGGAYNRVPPDATAFVHRAERFQLKHAAVVEPEASTGAKEAAARWVARSWGSVHGAASGRVFQNFPDPNLEHWGEAYYGPNLGRLLTVKARYDPSNVFRFDQSLPVR